MQERIVSRCVERRKHLGQEAGRAGGGGDSKNTAEGTHGETEKQEISACNMM